MVPKKKKEKEKPDDTLAALREKLSVADQKFNDYEFPKVSVIIPAYNCSSSISLTIERLLDQDYPNYEIIVIDGGSADRTLEVVRGFRNERIRIYSVSGFFMSEMLNKGISHATGTYINFLIPGDYYIYPETLKYMMTQALEHRKPNLVFCGTLVRDATGEAAAMFRHLSLKLLRKGEQATSLQACWFHVKTFEEIGKFDTNYALRGGFDLLCRYALQQNLRTVSSNRILTDHDFQFLSRKMVMQHFWESMHIIYKYFGFFAVIRWFFYQNDISRFLRSWLRSIKVAFLGRQ